MTKSELESLKPARYVLGLEDQGLASKASFLAFLCNVKFPYVFINFYVVFNTLIMTDSLN